MDQHYRYVLSCVWDFITFTGLCVDHYCGLVEGHLRDWNEEDARK